MRSHQRASLSDSTNAIAGQDPDLDGVDNWGEYIACTLPNDGSSRFVIETEMLTNGSLRVRRPSARHRLYSLCGCTNLVSNVWCRVDGDIPAVGSTNEVELTLDGLFGFLRGQADDP